MAKLNETMFLKTHTMVWGVTGFVAGIIYSFGGLAADALSDGLNSGTALAFLAIPIMPIIGAVFGLGTGFVGFVVYSMLESQDK